MTKRRTMKFKGRIRRCLLALLILPLLLWLVLSVIFSTPWGTGLIAGKIANRVGLPCSISRISWSPWSGVTVKDISFSSPPETPEESEVIKIERVEIDPSWSSLIRGKKRFERVEIHGLTGEISLELIEALVGRGQRQPVLPTAEPVPVLPADVEVPDDQVVAVDPDPDTPADTPLTKPADQIQPLQNDAPAEVVPVDSFEGMVVFEKVNIRLFSRQYPDLTAEVKDVEGELPIWGGRREGSITLGDFEIAGRYHSQRLVLPVVYEDNFLKIEEQALKVFGLDFKMKAAVRFVLGLPIGIQFEFPSQQMDLSPIYPESPSPIVIGDLQASARLQGHLQIPSSLTGESFVNFKQLTYLDLRDGSKTDFDSGSALIQLSSAGLITRDVRIVGEEEAVLGNGFMTTRGEGAAVVRIVASPGRADELENRVNRTSIDLDLQFQPLVTPDREYRDLQLEWHSGTPVVDLGRDEQWLPLIPVFQAIRGSRSAQPSTFP